MRFLPSLFGGDTKLIDNPADLPADVIGPSALGRSYVTGSSTPYTGNWTVERAIRDGVQRVIWVYKACDVIADNAARLSVVERRGDRRRGEIVEQPDEIVRMLNTKVSPWETAFAFRYRLSFQALLSKRGVFIELVYPKGSTATDPGALFLLPPDRTSPIPSADRSKLIDGFRIQLDDGNITDVPEFDELGRLRVLWIRMKPHPTDPFSTLTPLEAAGIDVDADFYSRRYQRNFMLRDGRPGGLIAVKARMDPSDADDFARRIAGGGIDNAGRWIPFEADGVDVVDLSRTPRDAQYRDLRKLSKTDILSSFGVPESKLGNAAERTFANADAEDEGFWQDTMLSHLDAVLSPFDELTPGGSTDDLFIGADVDDVDALARARRVREDRGQLEWIRGLISTDEYREMTGREVWDTPASRSLWVYQGRVPITPPDVTADEAMLDRGQFTEQRAFELANMIAEAAEEPAEVGAPPDDAADPQDADTGDEGGGEDSGSDSDGGEQEVGQSADPFAAGVPTPPPGDYFGREPSRTPYPAGSLSSGDPSPSRNGIG